MDRYARGQQHQPRNKLQAEKNRRPDENEDQRRQQQKAARNTINPDQLPDQIKADGERALPVGVLHGMRHFVRRDGDRRNRAAIVMLRQEPHGRLLRIIMVPIAGELDLDAVQPGDVEEVARELSSRSRQVRSLDPVALQSMSHPPLRPQKNHQQNGQRQKYNDRHEATSPVWPLVAIKFATGEPQPSPLLYRNRNRRPGVSQTSK